MIYTPMTKKAMKLMFEKHKDQVDKSGLPYVNHPFHVAEQMKDETTATVALLHDIVEDTDMTFEQLREEGFPEEVLDALMLLTHDPNVDYYDYVRDIGTNPIARAVKIKDLEHNMDLSRLNEVTEWDLQRVEKYKKCHDFLTKLELIENKEEQPIRKVG